MPITIDIDAAAEKQIDDLDVVVQTEIRSRLDKIRSDWPNVSGLKPMRNELKNHVHERVGDYRVLMKKEGGKLIVMKVDHRSKVYKKKRSSRDVEPQTLPEFQKSKRPGEAGERAEPTHNFASEYIMWSIGQNLSAARKAAHLTQKQLAEKIHRSQSTVSMAEKGQIRVSVTYVKAILRACHVPSDWGRKYWEASGTPAKPG